MKRTLMLVLAVLMVLPMLFSCQSNTPKSTKYGTEETAVKVTVQIKNPDYEPPKTTVPEGEEPEVDPENPEYFYNGAIELYVKDPTVKDALNAVFMKLDADKLYSGSIDDNDNVTIQTYTDDINLNKYWEYSLVKGSKEEAIKEGIAVAALKAGDVLLVTYTAEAPAASTTTVAPTTTAAAKK